ncbi:NTP transferase domain-containing protein [Ferruginibacter lapsinanis]|uniref:NTP transferase domain-containing protein n=1 Tax=Ferruginibacter lapsinanis TaxID=563172 RepID=UPI001E2F1EDB|nr:NTP transferase domain-containing protein [Ferruginibacter lapsinanis]UEG50552.1 NTP transferase domain-containing protein [Ferruginibacter lapsinanis]
MTKKIRLVIPAAGRSSRSGLNYPKTLYRLFDVPILVRIIRSFEEFINEPPIIIINPDNLDQFTTVLKEYNIQAQIAFQHEPLGMGNALLSIDDLINDQDDIILVWSDIPLLSKNTIKSLVNCHLVTKNDFSLVTALSENCYTIVKRNEGKLEAVLETRALGIAANTKGERDIGLFVFNKGSVFSMLKENETYFVVGDKKEHSFLYIIEKLVQAKLKVEGYPVAQASDLLSFNNPSELAEIEQYMTLQKV